MNCETCGKGIESEGIMVCVDDPQAKPLKAHHQACFVKQIRRDALEEARLIAHDVYWKVDEPCCEDVALKIRDDIEKLKQT